MPTVAQRVDPVLNGLVGLLSAYCRHMITATQPAPPHPMLLSQPRADRLTQAAQALEAVRASFAQHGNAREQIIFGVFEEDPTANEVLLLNVVQAIAQREPAFAQTLHELARQAATSDSR